VKGNGVTCVVWNVVSEPSDDLKGRQDQKLQGETSRDNIVHGSHVGPVVSSWTNI
jgi:hypothetical protein